MAGYRDPLRTPRQREKIKERLFRPIAIEIGWLVFEWNRLQEHLAELFAQISNPHSPDIPLAIWYSIDNDRARREMLRAAAKARFTDSTGSLRNEGDAIDWLVREVNKLTDRRHDAIHAPFNFVINADVQQIELHPSVWLGNPRARKFHGKDVLKEVSWHRHTARVLADYALTIFYAVRDPSHLTWPDKPQMPHLGQYPTQKKLRHQKRAK